MKPDCKTVEIIKPLCNSNILLQNFAKTSTLPLLDRVQVSRFETLIRTQPKESWLGRSPKKWAETISPRLGTLYDLPESQISRSELRNMWRRDTISTEACFLSTMAWGGMKKEHGQSAWNARSIWLQLCEDIRAGIYPRDAGFDKFIKLRLNKDLSGMGVAYFTKILFFAMPTGDSYILDQWTARSMHILTNQNGWPYVQIDHSSLRKNRIQAIRVTVTDKVKSTDYEHFCKLVELLGQLLWLHPHSVEEHMFGHGGKGKAITLWRAALRDNGRSYQN